MKTFVDLFCGIGGFRVALESKGLKCVFSSDIDEKAQDAYEQNFSEKPEGDITSIHEREIPTHDILCAGFPCQSFSISGDRKGLDDNRGRLFYEIVRIAQYHNPQILILENVKNILTVDNGNVIKIIRKKLDQIGYKLHVNILNSSHFGVPQRRERVYFVGLRRDILATYNAPKELNEKIYLENLLEPDVDEKMYIKRKDIHINKKDHDYSLKPIRIGIVNKGGQGERIYSAKGHSVTLSAYGGGVGARTGLYYVRDRVRKLTQNECKKLMGFSESHYVTEGTQGYQQLGNAVIPTMIQKVYESISFS
ncbi:MAG: DNA cytosine methyltransferase [Ignavibacteriae bacterium]|nr:DNA cytosine methyltransferase [Ignavibacteriota bacterium]MCB9243932.1 DNA cytosine methyltransferase [Ignavibacteriales bacterium]